MRDLKSSQVQCWPTVEYVFMTSLYARPGCVHLVGTVGNVFWDPRSPRAPRRADLRSDLGATPLRSLRSSSPGHVRVVDCFERHVHDD